MISSKVFDRMRPLFDIISKAKGKTIGQIKDELSIERSKMVKGASGLIVEKLLHFLPASSLPRLPKMRGYSIPSVVAAPRESQPRSQGVDFWG